MSVVLAAASDPSARAQDFRHKKRSVVLFYEVVECPEVVFFLDYDVFEHASCCCVAVFERFCDDLAVQ